MIGAGVVVAVVAIAGVAGALTAGSAAAASAASGDSDKNKGKGHSKPETSQSSTENNPPPPASIDQETIVQDHISALKEQLLEKEIERLPEDATPEQTTSLIEKTRDCCSYFAHEAVDAAITVISFIPEAMQEVREMLPKERDSWLIQSTPLDVLASTSAFFHRGVDWLLSTDQAERYANGKPGKEGCKYGMIPLPSGLLSKFAGKSARIPPTQALDVNGWDLGDCIRHRTSRGNVPKWTTVRARFWKNEALLNPHEYDALQLERMKKGLAPQRINAKSQVETMELHHVPPQREGGLFDFVKVWPAEHQALDEFRQLGR